MFAPLRIDLLLAVAYMLPLQQHSHRSVCECICAVLLLTDAGDPYTLRRSCDAAANAENWVCALTFISNICQFCFYHAAVD